MIISMENDKLITFLKVSFMILLILAVTLLFSVFYNLYFEGEIDSRIKNIEEERDYYRKQMLNFCELSKNYDDLITGDYKNKRLMDKPCDYYLINNTNKS